MGGWKEGERDEGREECRREEEGIDGRMTGSSPSRLAAACDKRISGVPRGL